MSANLSTARSLRRTADGTARHDTAPVNPPESLSTPRVEPGGHSPSRLPIKPTTRGTTYERPSSATGSTFETASTRRPSSRTTINAKTESAALQKPAVRGGPNSSGSLSTDPVKKDRSRPPITISRHVRNASISSFQSSVKHANSARIRSSSTTASSRRPPTRNSEEVGVQPVQPEQQLKRPTFSTLQQHFSPAKSLAPKPHPATFLAPPSPSKSPSNVAISTETAKLQNELLQLHILHKDSSKIDALWKASARRKLGARFTAVVEQNDQLVGFEVQQSSKVNAIALQKWQDLGLPGRGLEEKVQVLDEVITGAWNMNESGGRFAKVIKKFEKWTRRSQDIMDARKDEDGEVMFLDELDSGWRDDCLSLSMKLAAWQGQLKSLGVPDRTSSLGIVIGNITRLVAGMLQELTMVAQIEQDAMNMELEWIKSMNDESLDDGNDNPVVGAVWRSQ